MRLRRAPLFIAVLSLALATMAQPLLSSGPAVAVARAAQTLTPSMTFGAATVVDPVHTYGEPDIKVARNGSVYDSGPWGTGTQRSLWEQSTDRGLTFHPLHTP